jgi:hypothetical protein
VILLLTASSTACISSHCFVVVPVTAGVLDPSEVERDEGADELPAPELAELPVLDVNAVDALPDAAGVDALPDATAVVPVSNEEGDSLEVIPPLWFD